MRYMFCTKLSVKTKHMKVTSTNFEVKPTKIEHASLKKTKITGMKMLITGSEGLDGCFVQLLVPTFSGEKLDVAHWPDFEIRKP